MYKFMVLAIQWGIAVAAILLFITGVVGVLYTGELFYALVCFVGTLAGTQCLR